MGQYDAAITAAAQIADTAINASTQAAGNKKQREWAESQNNTQWERTKEMWNMTNAYNEAHSSPAYMMQRYKDAGLNPHLIYGQPNKVEANNMAAPNAPNLSHTPVKINTAAAMQALLQTKIANKQLESMDADIANKNSQTASIDTDTAQKQELFPTLAAGAGLDNLNKASSNQKIVTEIAAIGKNMNKTDQEIKNMQTQVSETLMRIKTLQGQQKLQEAELEAKNLANKLFRSTMQSEADAKNAENNLIKNTSGMGKTSLMQMPGIIIGGALDIINKNIVKPMQKPGWSNKFKD